MSQLEKTFSSSVPRCTDACHPHQAQKAGAEQVKHNSFCREFPVAQFALSVAQFALSQVTRRGAATFFTH